MQNHAWGGYKKIICLKLYLVRNRNERRLRCMSVRPYIDFHVPLGECMSTLKDRIYSDVKIS